MSSARRTPLALSFRSVGAKPSGSSGWTTPPAVLQGKEKPADTAERLAFAQIVPSHEEAMRPPRGSTAKPLRTAEADRRSCRSDRYNAACTAALAGCGQGVDADKLDAKERARLRQQALDWLRADLKAYRK